MVFLHGQFWFFKTREGKVYFVKKKPFIDFKDSVDQKENII